MLRDIGIFLVFGSLMSAFLLRHSIRFFGYELCAFFGLLSTCAYLSVALVIRLLYRTADTRLRGTPINTPTPNKALIIIGLVVGALFVVLNEFTKYFIL